MRENGDVAIYFTQQADAPHGSILSSSTVPIVINLLQRCRLKVIIKNWNAKQLFVNNKDF